MSSMRGPWAVTQRGRGPQKEPALPAPELTSRVQSWGECLCLKPLLWGSIVTGRLVTPMPGHSCPQPGCDQSASVHPAQCSRHSQELSRAALVLPNLPWVGHQAPRLAEAPLASNCAHTEVREVCAPGQQPVGSPQGDLGWSWPLIPQGLFGLKSQGPRSVRPSLTVAHAQLGSLQLTWHR